MGATEVKEDMMAALQGVTLTLTLTLTLTYCPEWWVTADGWWVE